MLTQERENVLNNENIQNVDGDQATVNRAEIEEFKANNTARADNGAQLGDVDYEFSCTDLRFRRESSPIPALGGLSLGGGFGWVSRKHGLWNDNLTSAKVVTADPGNHETEPLKRGINYKQWRIKK